MRVISINVGRPQIVIHQQRRYSTAIDKRPVAGSIELTEVGLPGDRAADAQHHGSADQALCCFAHEHYGYFAQRLGRMLSPGSFGENLTLEGLLETEAAIGDVYRIGNARAQISQPRQPCWKLANRLQSADAVQWIDHTGYAGFYMRVLQGGAITAGDDLELLDRPHPTLSVAVLYQTMRSSSPPQDLVRRCVDLAELSDGWRRRFREQFQRG